MVNTTKPVSCRIYRISNPLAFYTFLAFYLIVFCVVFGLSFFTPMVSDDFAYCFSWVDWSRIQHISQIIPSMAAHRNLTNGRVIVHGFVQLMLLLPRQVYCVLNALNAILLCRLIRRLISLSSWKHNLLILLFCVCYFCFFLPAFGENVLWLDGAVNYFWGLSCSLLFLFPFLMEYLDLPYSVNALSSGLRVILSFVFGTWSENASLVFLFLATCLFLLEVRKKQRLRLMPFLWIIAALAGYVFLMTAPATAGRAGASSISVIGYNFREVFKTAHDYLLWPLLLWAILFALAVSYQLESRLLFASGLLLISALLAHLSYTFAAYLVPRHLCTTIFLLLLSTVLLFAGLCRVQRSIFLGVAIACFSVLFLMQFPVGVLDVAISYHKQQLREQKINTALAADQRSVILENYSP